MIDPNQYQHLGHSQELPSSYLASFTQPPTMADLLSNKLHHSFSFNSLSLPLPLSSHSNLSLLRFPSSRRSPSSLLLSTKLSSSPLDIVSTTEYPDGSIVFKFGDASSEITQSQEEPVEESKTGDEDGAVTEEVVEEEKDQPQVQEPVFYHSPYPAYEDLKPPTSPTPSVPNDFPSTSAAAVADNTAPENIAATSSNGVGVVEPAAQAEQAVVHEQDSTTPKPRPLSPYTMYEDMKPPTSPTPTQS